MFAQRYHKDKTVLDAARERVSFVFDQFETITVSVSGGKPGEAARWRVRVYQACNSDVHWYSSSPHQQEAQ